MSFNMYINDLHILYYLGFGFIGLIIGQLIDWFNVRVSEEKQILSMDFFRIYIKNSKPHYIDMFLTAVLYVINLYIYGIKDVKTYENIFLIPLLISAFYMGIKKNSLSKRTVLTLLEIGIMFTFIEGISNLNIAIEKIIGALAAVLICFFIIFLEKVLFKKKTNNYEDMKLIVILGLFFGYKKIIIISVISYLIAAITDIILMIKQKKDVKENINLGSFVSAISIVLILVPIDQIILFLL